MTVKELIERLNKIEDQNIRVMVRGYEGGLDEVINIPAIVNVALNVNSEWYYGSHERVSKDHQYGKEIEIVKAIIL
jgi:hypothetical protein